MLRVLDIGPILPLMAKSTGGRGIEELRLPHEVTVDAFTGQAALRVAVPVPPGRAGFRPDLALVHAGGSNSAFGVGWALGGVPTITIVIHDEWLDPAMSYDLIVLKSAGLGRSVDYSIPS